MATSSSTPLWLDLKIDYIDENFDKVFNYIYQNNIREHDAFYDTTINLLENRINALIQEFHSRPLLQDETLAQDKERAKFIVRLLGLYLLSVSSSSKNYRTAFLLFVYALAELEPSNISVELIGKSLKFLFSTLPVKSILEWNDIIDGERFYPHIIVHKLGTAITSKMGFTRSDNYTHMGTLQLAGQRLKLAALSNMALAHSYAPSLAVIDDIIQVLTPKSDKLKQSKSNDIDTIREFTAQFIADQRRVCPKLKRYIEGEKVVVRLISKLNGGLQVVSTSKEHEQIQGEVDFSQNFFFYSKLDFINNIEIGDEFDAFYMGDNKFDIKTSFFLYTKENLFEQGEELIAQAVMFNDKIIGWGSEWGYGLYTNRIEGISPGDCAKIVVKSMCVGDKGIPTGWVTGEFVTLTNEPFSYEEAKRKTITSGFIFEKEETTKREAILNREFIKSIYRILVLTQRQCIANPTERYKIISVCRILATLINEEQDAIYICYLGQYLENLVHFARNEYDQIEIPSVAEELICDSVERRNKILAILQQYGTATNNSLLDDIIDADSDTLLVKLAKLVQSCNRLEDVINRSMQNVIKREIISSLAVETEGDADLEEENGTYLGIENDRQEFKTSFFHAPQNAKEKRQHINIFKGVCAFLNTVEGGTLYIGVNDLGYVQGIDSEIAYLQSITYSNYKGIDGYMRYITDEARKYFDIDVVTNIKTRPMYDNKVVALEVTPYECGIVKLEDRAYLRINGESVAINEAAIQRISSRKNISAIKQNPTIERLSLAVRSERRAVLHNYQSSNSGRISDRVVEVFDFTDDGSSIWCYDVDQRAVRLFNIARIGYVEITAQGWAYQQYHVRGKVDIFKMTGDHTYNICLRLNLRAKNLLVEEFPKAKDAIVNEGNGNWLFTTDVYNLAGVARFYIGLANSIQIVNAPELQAYIKEYVRQYL